MQTDILYFTSHPEVELAGNKFINVKTILQYDDTPLVEVVSTVAAGFTTNFSIYHSDGTYLAKVKGSQIYPTEEGKKAGLTLEHPDKVTVCRLDGQTLFEITRKDYAALKTDAELYTPDGKFIRLPNSVPLSDLQSLPVLTLRGLTMTGCIIQNQPVGIRIGSDGSISI